MSAAAFPPPLAAGSRALGGVPRRDGLTPTQRRAAIAAIVGVHGVAGWALLQVEAVREVVRATAPPIFVAWIAPPAPVVVPPAPEPPRPTPRRIEPPAPRPKPVAASPAPLVTAAPSPAPATFTAPLAAPVAAPAPAPAPPAPAFEPIAPPAPPPAAVPMQIPASAIDYLVQPAAEYPRLSARAGEAGRVMVRVRIDEAGLPHDVQVARTSGFPRLDAAAVAAVQKARFKPPTSNGQPISGWANVPIDFGLEK